MIIFGQLFRDMSLRADSDSGSANFSIFVPSLGLPKTTTRDGSSSSTAEKKAVQRDGVRLLIFTLHGFAIFFELALNFFKRIINNESNNM